MPHDTELKLALCDECMDYFSISFARSYPDLDTADYVIPHPKV